MRLAPDLVSEIPVIPINGFTPAVIAGLIVARDTGLPFIPGDHRGLFRHEQKTFADPIEFPPADNEAIVTNAQGRKEAPPLGISDPGQEFDRGINDPGDRPTDAEAIRVAATLADAVGIGIDGIREGMGVARERGEQGLAPGPPQKPTGAGGVARSRIGVAHIHARVREVHAIANIPLLSRMAVEDTAGGGPIGTVRIASHGE